MQIKRAYEPKEKSDGFRILVDRLWPRGIKKEDMHVDVWLKEIAPSSKLRKWFNHDVKKWKVFTAKYNAELKHSTAIEEIIRLTKTHKKVTLIYGAKDEQHNQAVVLKEFLQKIISIC
ncbi:DUF488 domain-containing protein [Panacibacter ginsenosidivorans]|uniref:DUF488 domain-containing protein n=1 Tax=Panacibacter ginsenosidivorans TaxID=1813871 RepID=A0A5B8VGU7_9BACT|nr:DUF488 domain-containing protein [Panacibacter ginsenosidivorans]